MRPEQFHADSIVALLRKQRIATLDGIKDALGTRVDMTVFRKLREIDYVRSYSHRGKYYALQERTDFDARGLWTHRGVRFSRFGSLVDTLEQFALLADRGYIASELAAELAVEVNGPLVQLVRAKRLGRKRVSGVYVYGSPKKGQHSEQIATRQREGSDQVLGIPRGKGVEATDEAKAAIIPVPERPCRPRQCERLRNRQACSPAQPRCRARPADRGATRWAHSSRPQCTHPCRRSHRPMSCRRDQSPRKVPPRRSSETPVTRLSMVGMAKRSATMSWLSVAALRLAMPPGEFRHRIRVPHL